MRAEFIGAETQDAAVCFCLQLVVRGAALGDLHPGGLSVSRRPGRGAVQAAEGRSPNGQALNVHS